MGRDLLYRPPVHTQLTDEDQDQKRAQKTSDAKAKHVARSREVSRTQIDPILRQHLERSRGSTSMRASENAYFNKDLSAVGAPNLASKPMQALRGENGALDLRQVVLPYAPNAAGLDPKQLAVAAERMGLVSQAMGLQGLLLRQRDWCQREQATVAIIEERMAELERMVADRIEALARLAKGKGEGLVTHPTILQASMANPEEEEFPGDVARAGTSLIEETRAQAEPMHEHLARALGLKRR